MATVATIALLAIANAGKGKGKRPFRDITYGCDGSGYIEGFVTHGVNNFNGEQIVDFTNLDFGLSWNTPIYEQQVLNSGGLLAEVITETTDRDTQLAMGRAFTDVMSGLAPITPDTSLYNQPYYDVGTITANSRSIDDRTAPSSFADLTSKDPSEAFATPYLPESVNPNPTLAEWEEGSGIVEIECENGVGDVTISVCNLIPEALYTVWEVGIANPGPEEVFYWHPAGGVGNVIRTDENGDGSLNIKMPWCPVRECIPGLSADCQIYFSVFHHSDYIVWGADAAGIFWQPYSYPAGIVGSNHLWFPVYGEEIDGVEPINRYDRSGQCGRNRGKRGNGGYEGVSDFMNNDVAGDYDIDSNVVNIQISQTLLMFMSALIIGLVVINIVLCYIMKKPNPYNPLKAVDSEFEYAPQERRAIKE